MTIKLILPWYVRLNKREIKELWNYCDLEYSRKPWNEDIEPWWDNIIIESNIKNLWAVANLLKNFIK